MQDSEFGCAFPVLIRPAFLGRRSLIEFNIRQGKFFGLVGIDLHFVFFRFHIFLVLLSTTPPNTPKKSTFPPLKNDAGKSTVMYCPSFWGTPSSLFRGELLNFGGVSEYPLLFGGVKLCLFWGAKFCRGSREYVFDTLSWLQKTLHAKEPSDPTPGLSCRLAFSDLKIVKKRI